MQVKELGRWVQSVSSPSWKSRLEGMVQQISTTWRHNSCTFKNDSLKHIYKDLGLKNPVLSIDNVNALCSVAISDNER